MELRHLRYFVAVAEDLNFTKAAARLHLAQPSLTRQIHNLEEEIGVSLLNRSKSQVALTEEGRSFLADARRILALATESILAVQRLSRGETGQLNIAYLSNFDFELLPETLSAFRRTFPHIALNLFDMTPAEQFRERLIWVLWGCVLRQPPAACNGKALPVTEPLWSCRQAIRWLANAK
jgi:DNA-binding transcriptional LysR family regulator